MKKFITIAAVTAFGFGAAGPAMADNYWQQHKTVRDQDPNGNLFTARYSYGTEWDRVSFTVHMDGRYFRFNIWAKCSGGTYNTWKLDGPDADVMKASWDWKKDAAGQAAVLCSNSGTTGRFL